MEPIYNIIDFRIWKDPDVQVFAIGGIILLFSIMVEWTIFN